jgi:hypothetical protein
VEDNGLVLQVASTGSVPTSIAKLSLELPPLILHPIAGHGESLAAGSASDGESCRADARRLELKMLCCLGKDLNRWLEQCMEFPAADPHMAELPESVIAKMQAWGVADFRAIFARALGLNAVFPDPPARENITESFARDFAGYAEALYRARRQCFSVATATGRFHYEVYASGEYARLLERSWDLQAG